MAATDQCGRDLTKTLREVWDGRGEEEKTASNAYSSTFESSLYVFLLFNRDASKTWIERLKQQENQHSKIVCLQTFRAKRECGAGPRAGTPRCARQS